MMNPEHFLCHTILFEVLMNIQPKTNIVVQVLYSEVDSRSKNKGAERGRQGRKKKTI